MAHAGQEIQGQDGFRLRLVQTAAETGGELLEMEASYGGTSGLPPEHLHPRRVEQFEVLEGTVRTIIGGTERRYVPGERFEVPAGTPHQMTGEGPSLMRWEIRPALRTAELFERLCGDGPDSAGAAPSIAEFLAGVQRRDPLHEHLGARLRARGGDRVTDSLDSLQLHQPAVGPRHLLGLV